MTILAELKKPFNLLSTAIAVLSLLLSVYFYYESLQKREPYYLPHQSSQIYSKAVASPKITVIDGDGKPVSGDIHVLEVSFWNNGRLPIEPVDVRTPIFVEFPEGYRLLDSKIVRENKPTITAFKLSEVKSEMSSAPRVRLEWAHLDPGLGGRLQFIYVGNANPTLRVSGDILDAEILNGSGILKRVATEWGRAAILLALLFAALVLVDSIEVKQLPNRSKSVAALFALVKLIAVVGFLILVFWVLAVPKTAPV
jgi:hypothetical protein